MLLGQVWTYWELDWFLLSNSNLCNLFEFLKFWQQNPLKNSISSNTLGLKIEKETLLDLTRLSNKTKNASKFRYSFLFYLILIEKIVQYNSFHAIALNRLKANGCMPYRAQHEVSWFERSQHDKTRQTILLYR